MFSFFESLRGLTLLSVCFRFLLATGCGAAIGYERSKNRHAAGLRTHIVVCIGATSVMLLNEYLLLYYNANADPARLGAQVISGIGFLGAGSIVITGHQLGQQIRGLTTAAGLWASACMGLVVGSGFYEAAIVMCCFLFGVIALLNQVDQKYLKTSAVVRVYIEYTAETPFSVILSALRQDHWHMTHLEYLSRNGSAIHSVLLDLQKTGGTASRETLLPLLRSTEGVLFVEDA